MDKDKEEPTSNSSQGSKSSRSSRQGAPNPYERDFHTYSRPVGHERNTRAPKAFEKKDSRGSDSTYQKALEAVANQESSSDDQKHTPASAAGSHPMNQIKVTGEDKPTKRRAEPVGASQSDATTNEQDKNVNLTQMEVDKTKVTEEELAELGLDDLSLNDKTAGDDLWATPMVSDESNESYFADDEATMHMSFESAMRQADRAEGMTPFKEIPEHLIERTQTGKVINVRPPSPNSPTSTLKRRVKELEEELEVKEGLVMKRRQEYHNQTGSLNARIYELEQQQAYLESTADEWKIKYERQKELAEEYLKMVDDREMEGHPAVSDLNESMSEESAERSRHLAELKNECDQLRQKVTEAEAKRDEYAANLAGVTQRLTTLATETFKLRNDLKLRDEAISTLENESKGHQERADEAERLRNEITKAMRDARDLTAIEGQKLKEEIKKVNDENEKVTADIQKVTKEGLKWQKEARRLDTMVTALELKDKEWQQQVAQKSQEVTKLNTELLEMTTTALAKDDELIATKNQLKTAAEEYTTLERDVTRLAEHIKRVENDTEKVVQEKTFQLHQHMLKVNEENQSLKTEKEEFQLKIRRLEDENKALNMSNKHKDEQLLQYGVRTTTVESPPPSYSKAHETGTSKSFHFDMPLRTGTGKGSVKNERDGEKVKDDKEPPSESYPHMSRGDPSQFPPHIETNVFIDERHRDRPSSRQERPRKSRYEKVKRNQNDDDGSEEEDDQRGQSASEQLANALKSMGRKTTLVTFDGSRDAVNGWTQLVRDTQRTYHLTDDQILIEIASAVKGPAKIWFEGEREIALQEETEYTVTEWMNKFKDEYGDRDEEVLGLREAMARKFDLGKESLDQFYQAIMKYKAKRIITEKQAVGFLIEGCRVDSDLYKALRTQQCRTPTEIKDFFRHWSAGEEKYKAPKGQRNQDYVTIRTGQVEDMPQQRMAVAPVQQPPEYRRTNPAQEVIKEVTLADAMVAAIQAAAVQVAAQARPAPQNAAPQVPQNVAPMNVGLPQQGVGNGNFGGNGYRNGNWNGGRGNFQNQNQGQGQGNFQPNRGNQNNFQQNQGSRTEFKFQLIDGWVANGVQMCQYCMYGNHQTQGCKFANTPPDQNPNLFAFNEWQRLRGLGGWRLAVNNGYDLIAQCYIYTDSVDNLKPENVVQTLYCADKYDLPWLADRCITFVLEQMQPYNCLVFLENALRWTPDHDQIVEKCLDIVDEFSLAVLQSDHFREIGLKTLEMVLRRDTLSAEENVIYTAVEQWAMATSTRQNKPPSVANHRNALGNARFLVRFPLLTDEQLAKGPVTSGLLYPDEVCKIYVYKHAGTKEGLKFPTDLGNIWPMTSEPGMYIILRASRFPVRMYWIAMPRLP
ncbi:uncharacterized protein LOC129595294 [Paramacrobiotus metropolitanus]|uniref:uncharacterized protein LOC129595294 n=1 Tax=Paramacrobiotus metropolitanus TaxID=2943436 RepID=UPI00244626B4|nr:uncharacterized protein LOC129595294 [Paramacrobiotus metropolitanus]